MLETVPESFPFLGILTVPEIFSNAVALALQGFQPFRAVPVPNCFRNGQNPCKLLIPLRKTPVPGFLSLYRALGTGHRFPKPLNTL